jgi:outer membrane biosynthesis protein TonB
MMFGVSMTVNAIRSWSVALLLLGSAASAPLNAQRAAPPELLSCSADRSPVYGVGDSVADSLRVDQPPAPLSGIRPAYPAELRQSPEDGFVLVEFVVETSGRIDLCSFKVIEASNSAFVPTTREALLPIRFKPGVKGGHPVRTRVREKVSYTTH